MAVSDDIKYGGLGFTSVQIFLFGFRGTEVEGWPEGMYAKCVAGSGHQSWPT